MLYSLLKWLFTPTVYGYFRSLTVKGRSAVSKSGPVIFVANHNSAFMDPIVLGLHIRQAVYFLARGEAFKSKLSSWIFGNLNMIPVYRPEVTPEKMHKNKEVFERCFEHLQKGKSLLIFPEGFSKTVRKLRPLKTGAARIALGAEDQNDFKLKVKIVPVGINYSDPHTFRSDLFINFGTALGIEHFKDGYRKDEKDSVLRLTKEIEERLEDLLVIVEDDKLEKLAKEIQVLCRNEYLYETEPDEKALETFTVSKDRVKAFENFQKTAPEKATVFKNKIDAYFEKLRDLGIRDKQVKNSKTHVQSKSKIPYFILGLPIFIYGFSVNILPYSTVRLLSAKIQVREDFVGSLKLALGAFGYFIFYILQMIVFASLLNWYWAILFVISLYPTGVFAVHYIRNFYLFRSDLRYNRLQKRKQVVKLKRIRSELINEMAVWQKRYL